MKWGLDTGAFKDPKHAENAHQKVNRTAKPIDAREMALAWRRAIKRRLEENGKAV
jgi:hypothetical protein